MRRTYRSKKETGGALDPRDVLLTMDSKSSLFDAFYINNIKQTKREMSIAPSVQFAASNRVRKRKYVKRLKEQEPVIRESSSTSAFLTPDKSFRVNKAPDPFDQLLNSSNRSLIEPIKNISSNKQKGKTYCKLKSLKKKKINYSSGESADSDKENFDNIESNTTQNTSDILSHKLLIEKEYDKSPKQDESIADIVKNLSLFNESKDKVSTSPRGLTVEHRKTQLSDLSNSPLCSTPYLDKYRGKSIYKFSPISINLNDSPSSLTISEDNNENDIENSILELKEEQKYASFNAIKEETVDHIKEESCEVQSPILPHKTSDNVPKTKTVTSNSNTPLEVTLQTSEVVPVLGFSNIDLDTIVDRCNKLEKDISITNISFEKVANEHISSVNDNNIENIDIIEKEEQYNSSLDSSHTDSSLESDENESFYGTCNSEDFEDEDNKQPIIVIERLNDSIFQKYYDKMADFSNDSSNNTQSNISNEAFSDEYASVDDRSSSITDSSKHDNSLDSDSNSDVNKSEEEVYVSFVTTRRRNEIIKDSFILSLDNSITSGSSVDVDKIVLNRDSIIENVKENNDKTLIENNKPQETNEDSKNISSYNVTDEEKNNIDECTETVSIPSPKDRNSCKSKENSTINEPSFKPNKSSKSPRETNILPTNVKIDANVKSKMMTRKSVRLNKESLDQRKFSLNMETSKSSIGASSPGSNTVSDLKQGIVLQPGKRWERSLSIYRRMTTMADHFDLSIVDDEPLSKKGRKYRQSVINTMEMQEFKGSLHNESINSRRSTFVSKPSRSTIRIVRDSDTSRSSLCSTSVLEESQGFLTEDCDDTIIELSKLSIADSEHEVTVLKKFHDTSNRFPTARDYVLRRCNQTDIQLFDECYPDTVLKNCRKIGEGVYGEVFLWRAGDGKARVLKIIPIAGNIKVNGENQKDYNEIISEIVIAMELSALRTPIDEIEKHFNEEKSIETLDLHSVENATDIFNEVLAVRCVYGTYPSRLLDLWDLYDECKGSENDNPAILPVDQQYIVLELANAGQDLESYQFNNAEQAYALFQQIEERLRADTAILRGWACSDQPWRTVISFLNLEY
ncbi:unnamed protein product [Euphydryas editha]|uniref:Protein kinase domain-containing protein n=1 Tax=Euphydryas editha TaxID=104508 RepID=A0AAU9TGF8_EUPED|nr:unnamed protein product [Euphydryas editha]